MNKIKIFTVMTLTSMMGVAGIAAGSSRISFVSKAAATPRTYDIVSLIAEQLDSSQEFQDVTITVDGFDFTYRTRNASKVIVGGKTTIEITNGFIYNKTALNGLNYVDVSATEQSGKANIVLAKASEFYTNTSEYWNTVVCNNGIKNTLGKMDAVDNAVNFSIVTNETIQLSKIEVSYTCTTGSSDLVINVYDASAFPDEFKFYVDPSIGKVLDIYTLQDFTDFAAMTRAPLSCNMKGWTINLKNDLEIDASYFVKESKFEGTFNGNNHKITYTNGVSSSVDYGFYNPSVSLFSLIGGSAKISDLYLNVTLTSDGSYVGGLASQIVGDENETPMIDSVHVSGDIVDNSEGAGGICGFAEKATFNSCSFSGTINNHSRTGNNSGGIVGLAESGTTISNSNLKTGGRIYGVKYTGGIVGYQKHNTKVEGCNGNGYIGGYTYSGGISGYSRGDIIGCTSSAELNCNANYAGGIVGEAEKNSTFSCSIQNCTYSGKLKATNTLGGIAGYTVDTAVSSCSVTDKASFDTTKPTGNGFIGGLIGYCKGTSSVTGCSFYLELAENYFTPTGTIGTDLFGSSTSHYVGYAIGCKSSSATYADNNTYK